MSTSDGGQRLSTNLLGAGGGGEQKGELTSNVGAVDGEEESPSTGVEQRLRINAAAPAEHRAHLV